MALLEIITYGHPILEKRAEDVSDITDELKQLAKDMIYTMYAYNGVGLRQFRLVFLRGLL